MKKTRKNDRVRLLHMLDAAEKGISFASEISREDFEKNELIQFALARAAEIVGEAASNITDDLQDQHGEIDWAALKGMRIRLAHAYFDINLQVLWRAATIEFPILVEQLKAILDREVE